ncbi:MAG: hypothetical protein ACKPGP_14680 [Dolichospermum sp.]
MSVFFRSPTYSDFRVNEPHFISHAKAQRRKGRKEYKNYRLVQINEKCCM